MERTAPNISEYVTVPRAARLRGISVKRLRRAVNEGRCRAVTVETTWPRVRLHDVDAWIESTRLHPTSHARQRVAEVLEREAGVSAS